MFKAQSGVAGRLRNGQIEFVDADGKGLARATIDTRRGVVWLAHPERGQCGPTLAREAFLECFRAHSEWIPQWINLARNANVALEGCSMARVPVTLYTRHDNLFSWWIPLPHFSGKPYARHIATLTASQQKCTG